METYILGKLETVLQNNLNDALDYIGNKYSAYGITLDHVPNHKIIIGETIQLDSCPSIYIFPSAEDIMSDRLIWDMDQGDLWIYSLYIDCFVEDYDPARCLRKALLYKRAIRKVLKDFPTLDDPGKINGSIIKGTRNSNLFREGQNLNIGVRIIYSVLAWEFDYPI